MKLLLCAITFLGLLGVASATDHRIIVHKAERRLEVWNGETLLHRFRIGLGGSPVGHKTAEGDGRTPEGRYIICVKNPQSRFYLSLGISYPGPADAAAGLARGAISQAEHDRIVAAAKSGGTPPWKTALGGEIFIHGKGSASDWTLGCIALDDPDMKTLFDLIAVPTPVEILP